METWVPHHLAKPANTWSTILPPANAWWTSALVQDPPFGNTCHVPCKKSTIPLHLNVSARYKPEFQRFLSLFRVLKDPYFFPETTNSSETRKNEMSLKWRWWQQSYYSFHPQTKFTLQAPENGEFNTFDHTWGGYMIASPHNLITTIEKSLHWPLRSTLNVLGLSLQIKTKKWTNKDLVSVGTHLSTV